MGQLAPHPDDLILELRSASDWDIANRYHEIKKSFGSEAEKQRSHYEYRSVAVKAVLRKAREVVGPLMHPTRTISQNWN